MELLHGEEILERFWLYPLSYHGVDGLFGINNDTQLVVTNKRLLVCSKGPLMHAFRVANHYSLLGRIAGGLKSNKIKFSYLLSDIEKIVFDKEYSFDIHMKSGDKIDYAINRLAPSEFVDEKPPSLLREILAKLPVKVETQFSADKNDLETE
jgi:hypothetical protein